MAARPTVPVVQWEWGSWQVAIGRAPFEPGALTRRYDARAAAWARRVRRLGFGRAYAEVLAAVGIPDGVDVLDVGIGAGDLSLALPARPRSLVGVDPSAAMRRVAQRRLAEAGRTARVVPGRARALPFADASFDVVLAGHVLEHIPDVGRALAEIRRVLRPGGRLIAFVTRRTLAGRLLQLRWRIRCWETSDLATEVAAADLVPGFLPVGGPPWCGWMSLVCVAQRPLR